MPSPSDTDFDSRTLNVSGTPSILEQITALSSSVGIKYVPKNTQPKILLTSGQPSSLSPLSSIEYFKSINPPYEIPPASGEPTMQLPPSSKIEYGPNDGLSETPCSPNEQIPARGNLTFCQRVNTQLSEWSLHLYDFLSQVCTATHFAIIEVKLWLLQYTERFYFVYLMIVIFCLVWSWVLFRSRFKRDDGSSTGPVLEERPVADVVKRLPSEREQYLEIVRKLEEYWRTH